MPRQLQPIPCHYDVSPMRVEHLDYDRSWKDEREEEKEAEEEKNVERQFLISPSNNNSYQGR